MAVTGFLSLWIQNTAAASMMIPIVVALVKQIAKYNKVYSQEPHPHVKSNQVACMIYRFYFVDLAENVFYKCSFIQRYS